MIQTAPLTERLAALMAAEAHPSERATGELRKADR